MSFATRISSVGKSFRDVFSKPDAEAAARKEERINELRSYLFEMERIKGLKAHEGWSIYTKQVEARLGGLTQQLKTVSADKLPLLQAQISELDFVLAIVPKTLDSAREAREELQRLSDEE